MTIKESVHAAIEAAVLDRLGRPGLFPALVPGVEVEPLDEEHVRLIGGGHVVDAPATLLAVLEHPMELADHPFDDWPDLLRELWTLGLIFLRDEASSIDPATVFSFSSRVIVERSTIGAFSMFEHGPLLLHEAHLEGHAVLVGPLELDDTGLGHHVYAGTFARIRHSFLGPFVKAQVAVEIDDALIASHCAIDGGNHFDFMPLAPGAVAADGVRIGPQCWIGQHVSLTAGALLGRGVVVAAGTVLAHPVGDHRLVAGAPPREFPVDWHVRHLDPAAARAAGRAQGASAAMLPFFGAPRVQRRNASTLELEYGYDASGPLADFHAGALEALFERLVPGVPATVTREGSRFRIAFAHAPDPHVAFDAEFVVELRGGSAEGELQRRIASALPATVASLVERALREKWLPPPIADVAAAIARELTAMADGGQLQARFSLPLGEPWCRGNITPIEAALATPPPSPGQPAGTDRIVAFLHARGLTDVDAETPLLSSGRIDSFGLAALLTEVEEHFGLVIDIDEVTAADFDRPRDIAEFVVRRRSG